MGPTWKFSTPFQRLIEGDGAICLCSAYVFCVFLEPFSRFLVQVFLFLFLNEAVFCLPVLNCRRR